MKTNILNEYLSKLDLSQFKKGDTIFIKESGSVRPYIIKDSVVSIHQVDDLKVDFVLGYGSDLSKILDEYLYSGVLTMGNVNDYVNTVNRVCPGLKSEDFEEIFHNLKMNGATDGDKLQVVLSDKPVENAIYSKNISSMVLSFKQLR